jgi:FlaA1/EpsC-like NDP-sugar epimerase
MKKQLISLPRLGKQSLVLLVDAFSIALAVWLAYSIRLDRLHFPVGVELLVYGIPLVIALPIFVKMGLYRAVFRYAGQHALWSIARAVFFYGLIFFAVIFFWGSLGLPKSNATIPRSLGILQPIILLVLIVLSRSLARVWLAGNASISKKTQQRTLVYGAGVSGVQIASSLQRSGQYYLVGYLDDDPQLRHKTINGLTIYGVDEIDVLINEYGVTDILLALPYIQQSRRNEILSDLRRFHVHVRSLPSMTDLAEGKVKVSDIRELDVTDLLGRNPVAPNKELFEKNIKNQVVMVTGAGGSIGSELTRQILSSRPKALILLEQSEFALYKLDAELRTRIKDEDLDTDLVSLLGNVCQYDWMKRICTTWQINTIYHAAAYKHVPIVEHNVIEGVLNNVWGTLNSARAAIETGVNQFILISTDKAVRPTNVMGASKRLAEMVLQALANQAGVQTQLSMVRFGNVLGSSGSVVPLFRSQINDGGPVTITHLEVTRYFMTVPEAAQLVIQAGAMATTYSEEDRGSVFILDMGQPVRIIDLAKRMIELSGFTIKDNQNPDGDIEISIVGLRPGEKLYEELLIGDNSMPTEHHKIMKAQEIFMPWVELEAELTLLHEKLNVGNVRDVYKSLSLIIPGFLPSEEIVDYFSKKREIN